MDSPHPPPDDCPGKSGKGRPNPGAKEIAAAALAAGATAKAAGEAAACSERSVRRWQQDPEFQRTVRGLRDEAIAAALNRLSSGMTVASMAIIGLIGSQDPHVRFKAAKAVIELAVKIKESVELEQRVADLEARLAKPGG
jgi:hypothetical protein